MAFALILPSSRDAIRASGGDAAKPAEADAAASQLRRDYERLTRWWLGFAAFFMATIGAFVAIGTANEMVRLGGPVATVDLLVVVLAGLISLAGIAILVMLWRSGRVVLDAAVWWLRLPYRQGWRQRNAAGWVGARTVHYELRVFVRITTATLATLIGIGGVSLFVRDLLNGLEIMSFSALAIGLIGLASGFGQFGGVFRLTSGMSEADPLWVRIRSAFASSKSPEA
ncbi:hypothetical protein [Humidisolicoccus flavus]|uniref:hypothetical protein n=1 Tax=Humidisolicoccus flavus TaxID=3111414 RepID=UPI003254C80F